MSEYQEQSCVNSAITNSSLLPYIITATINHYCDSKSLLRQYISPPLPQYYKS